MPSFLVPSAPILEAVGIGGSQEEMAIMASRAPAHVLASWWYIQSSDWAKNPQAVLRTHLLTNRRTPKTFTSLATWWLASSSEQHNQLREAKYEDTPFPDDFDKLAQKAALQMYKQSTPFDL